jgi:hypothetical protein
MGLVSQIVVIVSCVCLAVFVSFFGSLPAFRYLQFSHLAAPPQIRRFPFLHILASVVNPGKTMSEKKTLGE